MTLHSPQDCDLAQPLSAQADASARAPLQVLVFPKHGDNPFLGKFSGGLEQQGATVDDFTFKRALLRRYDVLHVHWPDSHLLTRSWWRALGKHARLALLLWYLRWRGTHIVWMMHNLEPHERNHWLSSWLFARWFPQACTHAIALSQNALHLAQRLYPALRHKRITVIPHGHYREADQVVWSRQRSRAALELPQRARTLLFFGSIRPYKNVPCLLDAFRQLPGDHIQLVVAGLPALGVTSSQLHAQAQLDPRVCLRLSFVAETDVPKFMAAADLVVLPFHSILNSGSVLLALSHNRPVLAPRLGALPEIQAQVGERWLRLYEGEIRTAVLAAAVNERAPHEAERPDLTAFDWQPIAERTMAFYRLQPQAPGAGCG
jgi:glycosyltransferase involved in cell wall biosynthesis